MNETDKAEFHIEVSAADTVEEELDRLTRQLLSKLRARDVESAELAKGGLAPKGSKGDILTIGTIAVQVLPAILLSIIGLVLDWATRGQGRAIKFRGVVGREVIEFESSLQDLQKLLESLGKRRMKKSGKYSLIIGNKEYIDPGLAQLTAPGKDTEDFARVRKDQEICAFDQVNIMLDQLSSTAIEAIDEFFDEKKPDDLLVLYFSGHGVRDELGSLYLAFKNAIRSRLRSTAVKSDYIREAMDQSRSKRQVVILDCCNSGAFPQGTKAQVGGTMGMISALQGYGRFVLTASDATQFAWEGNKVIGETQNSLFTHFLVKGLEGEADVDGDGQISVDELYDYAYQQIARITPKQTPTKSASKQEGEIILRKITRLEDIRPVSLPPALIDSIENPLADVRLAAVQQLAKSLNGKNLGLVRSAREALKRIATKDDSRRVVQAAMEALEPRLQTGQIIEQERLPRENAALEKTVHNQAELERARQEAIEKTEREAKETETRAIAEKRRQTHFVMLNKTTHIIKMHYRRILLFSITVTLIIGASMFVPLQLLPLSTSTPPSAPNPTNTLIPISTNTVTSASLLANTQTPACQIDPHGFRKD